MKPFTGRKATLAAGIAALIPFAAHAQTPRELPPITAEDQQPDTAPSQTTLSGEQLQQRQGQTSDSIALLSGEPSVSTYSNGGISSLPVLRGLNSDRVLVTVDGEAITAFCPNHMNPPGSYVLANRVSAISVSPTLAPVSAGGDNIAGVIAIDSARIVFSNAGTIRAGEVGVSYRSAADALGATVSGYVADERISLGYDAAWTEADNYRTGGGNRVRSTAYQAFDHTLTLGFQPAEGHELSLRVGEARVPYEGFPTQRMDMVDNYSVFADAGYAGAFGWGQLNADLSWRHVDHEMNFLEDKGGAAMGGMPMLTEGEDISARLSVDVPLSGGGAVRAGVEAFQTRLDDWWPAVPMSMMMGPNPYININDGQRDRLAAFAEWQAHPSAHWTTNAGVRFERVETDAGDVQPYSWVMNMMNMADINAANAFNAREHQKSDDIVDATLSAVWRPNADTALELGASRRTRVPNLYERYAWGEGAMSSSMTALAGDANAYVGDIDLKPEVAQSIAATVRLGTDAGERSLVLSAYSSWVDDFIDADLMANLANGFVQLRFANHDARLYGFEASGHVNLWSNEAFGDGRLRASIAYVHGENEDTGDNLYHIAPLSGRIALDQSVGRWTNTAEIELVGEKDQVNALRREPVTGGYALAHLRSSADFGRWRLSLAAENLFDTRYDLPLGGVSYGDFRAGGSVPPIGPLPGPGRSINVGLNVSF
ncbi:MAG: TonB-dependent receptor [Hyphomonadaceae bacterium]|nr:TonB-dependent receptor [Hyphomonadaceae bacterium]